MASFFRMFSYKRTWIIAFVLIFMLIGMFSDWIVEWLWMDALGYVEVFWTIKWTQILLMAGALVISLGYVLTNMSRLAKNISVLPTVSSMGQIDIGQLSRSQIKGALMGAGAFISVFFSLAFFMRWDTYFRFHQSEVFGQIDPIFGNDIGFYIFRLPFLELLQNSFTILVFFVMVILAILYLYSGTLAVRADGKGITAPDKVTSHLSTNLGIWLLLMAWGYFLDRYQLLYNDSRVVYGADYVDLTVNLPVLWILAIGCLALSVIAFVQIWRPRIRPLIIGAAALVIIGGLGQAVVPAAVQSLMVAPNELQLQTPYIEHNIRMTRQAFELDQMNERDFAAGDTLTRRKLTDNQVTLDNIRLWDPRLIIQTYRQLQEIRTYYQFYNVDIDRYETDEGYMQMMISARELSHELPDRADTWVNRTLQYTHGYGVVMSPVAQEGLGGDPRLVIRDLPPVSTLGIPIEQPAIYYGETNADYKIVNTNVEELDFPRGDANVYTNYSGEGGVSISGLFRKLLFAWHLGDMNILLTDYINEDSKIIFWKRAKERINKIAPFLELYDDPYVVISEGRLVWIQDAYTESADYPYSDPVDRGYNYIRNSVKVVVDAYDGTVDFYAIDDEDPILNVYREVFPDMFKSYDEMPESIRSHIRYPVHLFLDQIEKYNMYHMTNPQVFYNTEDLWTRPDETYAGQPIKMEPYYVLSKLPGEEQMQYLLISPLTPDNRDNMIGWMAAKSDAPEYGEVSVFQLPKERLILGPAQIEARIDQDTEISRQLALWDQRGSRVIRGNLMIIPIEDSFLYVEPVFLIAEGVDIPQLQRVIVTAGGEIAMQPTLEMGIAALYGESIPRVATDTTTAVPADQMFDQPGESDPRFAEFQRIWEEAQSALQDGDWALFGEKMRELDELTNE